MPPPILNGTPATAAPSLLLDQFGGPLRRDVSDPAWQPPTDPLANGDVKTGVIHREIPLSVVITGWDVPSARAAKQGMVIGMFEQAAQMADAIMFTDSRVQAGLASRLSILGRPVDFRIPRKYRDSALAKECCDAFVDAWPEMATEAAMGEMQRWAVMMGFGVSQILWDTSGEYAIPHPLPWHPRYVYYHWLLRCYVAISLDGQEPIIPGDGSWMLHAPHRAYRGWMRGAMGAIAPWWLGRSYALRDWMRYSEKHGLPILRLKTPAVGDPYQQKTVAFSLARLGQEGLIHLPQNPPPALSYEVDLLEAKDTAHEGFRMLIEQCNQEVTLALLAQTLTTSMPAEGGSSYAAARVHAGVLQGLLEGDARGLGVTVYRDLSRPFAAVNFGNPDIACRPVWDVTPFEDAATKAQAFLQLSSAIAALRTAGFQMGAKHTRRMMRNTIPGFDPGPLQEVDPIALASVNAKAKADADAAEHAPKGEKMGDKGALARISRLMSNMDPRLARLVGERSRAHEAAFVGGEDDGLREAMADMAAAKVEPRRYTP